MDCLTLQLARGFKVREVALEDLCDDSLNWFENW